MLLQPMGERGPASHETPALHKTGCQRRVLYSQVRRVLCSLVRRLQLQDGLNLRPLARVYSAGFYREAPNPKYETLDQTCPPYDSGVGRRPRGVGKTAWPPFAGWLGE